MSTIRPKDRSDVSQVVTREPRAATRNLATPQPATSDAFGGAQPGTVLPVDRGERAEASNVPAGAFRLGALGLLGAASPTPVGINPSPAPLPELTPKQAEILREVLAAPSQTMPTVELTPEQREILRRTFPKREDEGMTAEEAEARVRADGDFQELSPEVQEQVLATITNPDLEPEGRETLVKVVTSGEFTELTEAEQQEFLAYAGNTIDGHGEAIREEIAEHMKSEEYRHPQVLGRDAKGRLKDLLQARELMQIVRGEEALPHSTPVGNDLPPAERDVEVRGPEEVAAYPFEDGPADALKYTMIVDGEEVEVYYPADAVENQPTIEELEAMVESMPDEFASELSVIVVEPNPKPSGASASVGADEVIHIWPNQGRSVERLASTLNHEVAHIIAGNAWGHDHRVDAGEDPADVLSPQWQNWAEAAEADGTYVSDYAQNSATGDNDANQVRWGEDFAETVELYLQVRGTEDEAEFAALYPNRYAILQEMFGDA